MAYIYKITNLINEKSYIDKTLSTIEERWKEHCCDAHRDAGKYIQSLDPEKRKNLSGICEHISGVAKGKKKNSI